MICHQNNFANAASGVFGPVTTAAQFAALKTSISNSLSSSTLKTIYSWDVPLAYNTPGSASPTWGQAPLLPAKGC